MLMSCTGFAVELDKDGAAVRVAFAGDELRPLGWRYLLDGEPAEAEAFEPGPPPRIGLRTASATCRLRLSAGDELSFCAPSEAPPERVGFRISLPADAELHLAEFFNVGRVLDADIPVGESYTARLACNFLLMRCGGMWTRLRVLTRERGAAGCKVTRRDDALDLVFTGPAGAEATLRPFGSLEAALRDHESWLHECAGLRPLVEREDIPDWVHDVRLVVTVDMMRSNWEVSHDYGDLLRLARDIRELRQPGEILFYIPGWQGAYDSTHPTYRPHPELGGERQFRHTMEALHEWGFRVMIHTTAWGIDPYHPDIDRLVDLVRRRDDGSLHGWQTDGEWAPANRKLDFTAERVPLDARTGSDGLAFETVEAPEYCEALFTIGGVRAPQARVGLTLGRRTVRTPPGWFGEHDAYDFPFPLALHAGRNVVTVTVTGGQADFADAWYSIRRAFTMAGPYSSWTWPILVADADNPEYIRIFTENVSQVVKEFGIDAVHIDADEFEDARRLFLALREALPGTPIGGEWVTSLDGVDFVTFCQGARQSLLRYRVRQTEQGSLPVEGLRGLYQEWLDKPSPVCRMMQRYVLMYPHLCAANAFVPVGKVCNIFPKRRIRADSEELWSVLRSAGRLGYLPELRVNYRDYGLDEDTRRAIREIGR